MSSSAVFTAADFCLITLIILAPVIVLSLHYWNKVNINESHAAKPLLTSLEIYSSDEKEMHVDLFKSNLAFFPHPHLATYQIQC